MSWLRMDDGVSRHPKVTALTHKDRWIWLDILCYCATYNTDGYIPRNIREFVGGATPKLLAECVRLGLFDEGADGLRVHDWREYQPKDPTSAERQARWRQAHGGNSRNGDVTADVTENAVTYLSTSRARVPVPSPRDVVSSPAFALGVGEGYLTPWDKLVAACGNEHDTLLKLKRASKGCAEGDIVHALEAASGPRVRDPLAVALSELKKRRTA